MNMNPVTQTIRFKKGGGREEHGTNQLPKLHTQILCLANL